MGVLSIYHPDIEDFIYAKSKEANRLNHFNLSVMVDDDFMLAVENDSNITLHYPVYDEKYHIIKDSKKWKYTKKVSARELWDKIMKLAYVNGEPGIMFYDNMNKMNNTWYTETITHTNPCVTGDTLILTKNGYQRINECINQQTVIWNGFEWSEVTPKITGRNQEIIKFTFSDGSELKTTPYHKFIMKNGERIEGRELIIGDKISKFNYPIIEGNITDNEAYTKGFYSGDGTYLKESSKSAIYLYGEKKKILDFLWKEKVNYEPNCQDRIKVILPEVIDKTFVPDSRYTIKTRLDWLAGLLDSDGTNNSEDGALSIASIDKVFLKDVKLMLSTLGIASALSILRKEGFNKLPSSNREQYKDYYCQECYRLTIRASMAKKLFDLGLECHRIKNIANSNRDASRFITITNIEWQDELEPFVYCFNEPKNHSGVFNGIMTAQCSEYIAGTVFNQELPSDQYAGACNLGSLMLHNFVEKPFTDTAYFDFSKLSQTIKIAVRMLDNIIDINTFPLPQYENYQKNFRTIGLGVTGLADMLVMLGYKYNSKEAVDFVDTLMEFIAIAAYNNSINLAIEKGPFPFCEPESFIQSGFINAHKNGVNGTPWYEISDRIERYGIRNARILSVAPCGTMSLTFGNNCSSGIEPIFSLGYDRKVKIGGQNEENEKIIHINDYAYENCPNKEEAPFITAQEMTVQEHIDMLAVIAKHIDMSVSKTINVPTDYSFEDTKNIYFDCWKKGIKGCTIFRPNEIRQGILLTEAPKKEEKVKEERKLERGEIKVISDDVIGKKRRLISGCGSLHCAAYFDRTTGELLEVFLDKGSTGGCDNFMTGLSRMISLAARAGCSVYDIVDQLNSSGTCPSYAVRRATKYDTSPGSSCPVAVGNALLDMQIEINEELEIDNPKLITKKKETKSVILPKYKCPECGSEITFEGGCQTCKNCGWSKCS